MLGRLVANHLRRRLHGLTEKRESAASSWRRRGRVL